MIETPTQIDKPRLRREWVDALRSGEFKQGKRFLQHKDKYCCLGVACVIAERHGVLIDRDEIQIRGSLMQRPALDALGLRTAMGGYGDSSGETLIYLNDNNEPFSTIADIIEAHADTLFTDDLGIAPATEGGAK